MNNKQILKWFAKLPDYDKYVEAIGEYNPELGYAGPEDNKLLAKLIPETAYGIDLNLCFYQHDAKYAIGGNKHDRWLADGAMLLTALYIIENTPDRWFLWGFNTVRKHGARVRMIKYYEAVRGQGYQYFKYWDTGR